MFPRRAPMSKRAIIVVLDGVGIGAAPDAADYGDVGSDTLGNLSRALNGLSLPNLEAAGLGNIAELKGVGRAGRARAARGLIVARSAGEGHTHRHLGVA